MNTQNTQHELVYKIKPEKYPVNGTQKHHRVLVNGQVLGTVYDNTKCETQRDNFVFQSCGTSRINGRFLVYTGKNKSVDNELNLPNIRGNELHDVLAGIRNYVESVQEWINKRRAELAETLAKLPEARFEFSQWGNKVAATQNGATCQVLGEHGSFTVFLTWAEIANLFAAPYETRNGFQITDSGLSGKDWGMMWFEWPYSPKTVHYGTYGKDSLMAITKNF